MDDDSVQSITIEEVFDLTAIGLVIQPDFPSDAALPHATPLPAQIAKPDNTRLDCQVSFDLTHFNIRTSTDLNKRWRLVPRLHGIMKEKIGKGDVLTFNVPQGAVENRSSASPVQE